MLITQQPPRVPDLSEGSTGWGAGLQHLLSKPPSFSASHMSVCSYHYTIVWNLTEMETLTSIQVPNVVIELKKKEKTMSALQVPTIWDPCLEAVLVLT